MNVIEEARAYEQCGMGIRECRNTHYAREAYAKILKARNPEIPKSKNAESRNPVST